MVTSQAQYSQAHPPATHKGKFDERPRRQEGRIVGYSGVDPGTRAGVRKRGRSGGSGSRSRCPVRTNPRRLLLPRWRAAARVLPQSRPTSERENADASMAMDVDSYCLSSVAPNVRLGARRHFRISPLLSPVVSLRRTHPALTEINQPSHGGATQSWLVQARASRRPWVASSSSPTGATKSSSAKSRSISARPWRRSSRSD